MSHAMKSVVATHVKYENPEALEEMLAHRQGLIFDMKRHAYDGYDISPFVTQLEDDVASILEGLEALQPLQPNADEPAEPETVDGRP